MTRLAMPVIADKRASGTVYYVDNKEITVGAATPAPTAEGSLIISDAVPAWIELLHPLAAFYHLETSLTTAAWSQILNVGTAAGGGGELLSLRVDQNAETHQEIVNADGGAAATAGLRVKNTAGSGSNHALRLYTRGTGYSTSGLSIQDSGEVSTGLSLGGGLVVRTLAATPVICGVNTSDEVWRADANGLTVPDDTYFNLGTDLDSRMRYDETTDDRLEVTGAPWHMATNLTIDGIADTVQLTVQAHSTQTANIQEWQNSGGTVLSHVYPSGGFSIDQSGAAAAIPALKLDQGDASEPCILFSGDGADQDIVLWELDVTGTPALSWDESEDALEFSHALAIRATMADATGLYVPWLSGDSDTTARFGSANASNDQIAIEALSHSYYGVHGQTGVSIGVVGTASSSGTGGSFTSSTGIGLTANLTGAGSYIAAFRDGGYNVLVIEDGGNIWLGPTATLDLAGNADALILDDDGDTTISAPTDDQIDFETGGVNHMRLVAAGLGIGSVAPSPPAERLHLYESADDVRLRIETDKANGVAAVQFLNDARQWNVGVNGSDSYQIRDVTGGNNVIILESGSVANAIHATATGVGIGAAAPGSLMEWNFATEDLEFVDAGSAGATEQDWIRVEVGGVTGYIRVYAAT